MSITMHGLVTVWSLLVLLTVAPSPQRDSAAEKANQQAARQLAAVRGEIVKIAAPSKGMLLITVKPAKEFPEITVLARENDLVGAAVGRAGESDLLGLLSDDTRDDETITAAELNQGDVVSVIYDPQRQNRVLEIYIH
jgi:DNA-directed RNA polymerase subunit H (RpoH/RPB5)